MIQTAPYNVTSNIIGGMVSNRRVYTRSPSYRLLLTHTYACRTRLVLAMGGVKLS